MKALSSALFISAALASLSGCSQIPEGYVGLEIARFTNSYNNELHPQGMAELFSKSIVHIAAHQNLIDVKNLRPKDKDGVLLKDMDITVVFHIRTENQKTVVDYIRHTQDIQPEPHTEHMLVGARILSREAMSSVQEAMREFTSIEALNDRKKLDHSIRVQLQKDIDSKYPGMFVIDDIKTYAIMVADSVEQKTQQLASMGSQTALNLAQTKTIDSQAELMKVEALAIKKAADASGLTVSQIQTMRFQDILAKSPTLPQRVRLQTNQDGTPPAIAAH